MILIGISGKKGSGKDLLASYFVKDHNFAQLSFAEELKHSVRRDFNLTKEHTDGKLKEEPTEFEKGTLCSTSVVPTFWTAREIMIAYGQFFRQFDPLWWVKKTFDKTKLVETFNLYYSDTRFVISDVRFKNEAKYIKREGGYLLRLERKPELNIYKTQNDVSETDLDDYNGFDLILDAEHNIVPEDLEKFTIESMQYILSDPRPCKK